VFGISDFVFMDRCVDIHKYLGTEVRNLIKTHVRPLPSLPARKTVSKRSVTTSILTCSVKLHTINTKDILI